MLTPPGHDIAKNKKSLAVSLLLKMTRITTKVALEYNVPEVTLINNRRALPLGNGAAQETL